MNRAFSNGDILFMSMAASTSVGNAFGNEKVVFFRLPICIIVNEALSHNLFTQHVYTFSSFGVEQPLFGLLGVDLESLVDLEDIKCAIDFV